VLFKVEHLVPAKTFSTQSSRSTHSTQSVAMKKRPEEEEGEEEASVLDSF
jgi:hypothetical protein